MTILFMIHVLTGAVTTQEFNTEAACLNAANFTDKQLPGVYQMDCYPKTLIPPKKPGKLGM